MERKPRAPGYVCWVTRTLEDAGYETWAVGGSIRNALLGIPAGDWDLATRAPPEVVQRLFPRTVPIGIDHGTVGVLTREGVLLEVTTFRRDVETTGRHAVVEFADTLQEDLGRRDFTVNAVAWHPLRGEFQDPFHGRADLDAGILRTVGSPVHRFSEDYLRVLRALRFSGRFGLRIEDETWTALCGSTDRLHLLSPERVREELLKILTQDSRPSGSLALYASSGVLEALYPEVSSMGGTLRPGHDEDLLVHSLLLTDLLPATRPLLRLTALLHGLGVPGGDPGSGLEGGGQRDGEGEGGVGFPARWRIRGSDRAAALLLRGRYANAEVKEVVGFMHMGLEPPLHLTKPSDLRRWLYAATPSRLPGFSRIWLAKARLDHHRWGRDPDEVLGLIRRLRGVVRTRPPLRLEELAVNGRDLIATGLKPGPRFGEILESLMGRVLENPGLNTRNDLLDLVGDWASPGEGSQ